MNAPLHLGDAELDEQHARLEALIVQLVQAPADRRVPALDELRAHAAEHFGAEDISLVAMADGNAKCHIDEHASVLKSLDEVREVLVGEQMAADAKASLVRRLADQLLHWLPEHVQAMDAGVATHRSKQRFGGAPIKLTRRV